MRYIDDKNKNLKWWNRNYFWIGTVLYIFVNLMLYMCVSNFYLNRADYSEKAYAFVRFFTYFADAHLHGSWEHVLHNMLGYAISAFYIERKMGSVKFIGLNLFITAVCAMSGAGCSVIWFFMIGYALIDYLFSFRKLYRNLANTITGGVVLALEYFRCCFYDKSGGGIGITYYPAQLLENYHHMNGFMVGVATALFVHILLLTLSADYSLKEVVKEKMHKAYIFVYSAMGGVLVGIAAITLICGLITTTRTTCKVNIVCAYEQFNKTIEYNVDDNALQDVVVNEWYFEVFKDHQWVSSDVKCSITPDFKNKYNIGGYEFYERNWRWAYDYNEFIPLSYKTEITIYVTFPEELLGEAYEI